MMAVSPKTLKLIQMLSGSQNALMSQMDMGGAIQAKEIAHGRVVTVRVDGMTFLKPVAVGDVVCCNRE